MKRILIFSVIVLLVGGLLWLASYEKRNKVMDNQEQEEKIVRQPAVEGQFYPDDKQELTRMVNQFLQEAGKAESEASIWALIVPHAGHVYSGGVAAYGFKAIQGQDIDRVILIGSSHSSYLDKAVIDGSDAWQTLLGQVALDTDLRDKLIQENNLFKVDSEPHKSEHSLEVELPFLQTTLNDFNLLPILVSHQISQGDLDKISQTLAKYVDNKTLLVISSDMSHYPSYDQANSADNKVIEAILTGQLTNLQSTISQLEKENIANLDTCLCGQAAVEILMRIAGQMPGTEIKLLKYANSGDVSIGEKTRVVGYGAISFSRSAKESQDQTLSQEQRKTLLSIARQSVEDYVSKKQVSKFDISDPDLNEHLGAFVTLKKHGQLRGCIGRFALPAEAEGEGGSPDIPLYEVVSQMAVSAAVNDARFQPVEADELNDLDYEISVLSPLRKIQSWQEIELGKHGVQIKKGSSSGVFLPQVATDNSWDMDKFMGELCSQKVGLDWDCWKTEEVDIYVFTAEVFE